MNALFARSLVEQCIMSDKRVEEFKSRSNRFEYKDQLGTVIGYKDENGVVLITELKLFSDKVQ